MRLLFIASLFSVLGCSLNSPTSSSPSDLPIVGRWAVSSDDTEQNLNFRRASGEWVDFLEFFIGSEWTFSADGTFLCRLPKEDRERKGGWRVYRQSGNMLVMSLTVPSDDFSEGTEFYFPLFFDGRNRIRMAMARDPVEGRKRGTVDLYVWNRVE